MAFALALQCRANNKAVKSYTLGAGVNSDKGALAIVRAFERFQSCPFTYGAEFELMTEPNNFHT